MMRYKLYKCMIVVAGLILLQQAIAFGSDHSTQINKQTQLIKNREIDPSALFYMESKLALDAEKTVRKLINDRELLSGKEK